MLKETDLMAGRVTTEQGIFAPLQCLRCLHKSSIFFFSKIKYTSFFILTERLAEMLAAIRQNFDGKMWGGPL